MGLAGLLYGPEFHHLDHLAPLCAQISCPLIVTDDQIASQAAKFYPDLKILHWNPHETPEKLVTTFDTIIYSTPRALFDEVFFFAQALHNKRIKTIWCPHGNSDKGRNSPFMEGLQEEKTVLTYGPRIEAFLREKGVKAEMIRVGNYRFDYWKRNEGFYDALLPEMTAPTLLYAPTWQDREKNSSFPHFWKKLLDVPTSFSLLVKLHPHLYRQYPEEIETLKSKAPENVRIIEDFPPIYPILARTDLYIGDMSSIGYDFLAFNRPMLQLKGEYDSVFSECEKLLEKKVDFSSLYGETFDPSCHIDSDDCDIVAMFSSPLHWHIR